MSISIANRILLGFAAILALTLAIGGFALTQIADMRDTSATIVARDIGVLRELARLREGERALADLRNRAVVQILVLAANRPLAGEAITRAQWDERLKEVEVELERAVALARSLSDAAVSDERRSAWTTLGEHLAAAGRELAGVRRAGEEMFAALEARDVERTIAAHAASTRARDLLIARVAAAEEALSAGITAGQQRMSVVFDDTRRSVLVGVAATALLGLLIAWLIRRSIVGPLTGFMGFVGRIGTGDLAGEAAAVGRDEIGRLGTTLNGMVEGLRQLAGQTREATENLNAAVAEIRASTQEQAAGVEEQLAAVQETAATVDEITHAGSQIGKRAQEVIAAAQATAATSNQGLQAVEDTVQAMDSIREQAQAVAENIVALSEKTQAIGEIITTVNDISERSHLLALNAAIEAAAAGESGRSFAVVAAEMKLLADQAKEATVQVRSILGDIQRGINASVMLTEEAVKRVASGKERTDVTQRTIEEITGRIQDSVLTFQQIVASTNQQQFGIEQVMGALTNIRQASQQTAAGTRQLDAAAANLAQMAQALTGLAARYRL